MIEPSDTVTASDLVRHFGPWHERALRAPVYVMVRGRPRLILASINAMKALANPDPMPRQEPIGPDATALLDMMRDMMIVADDDMRVAASSRAARAYFGESLAVGKSADAFCPEPSRATLLRSMRHVQTVGVPTTIEVPSHRGTKRRLRVTVEPHRGGVALLVVDLP